MIHLLLGYSVQHRVFEIYHTPKLKAVSIGKGEFREYIYQNIRWENYVMQFLIQSGSPITKRERELPFSLRRSCCTRLLSNSCIGDVFSFRVATEQAGLPQTWPY